MASWGTAALSLRGLHTRGVHHCDGGMVCTRGNAAWWDQQHRHQHRSMPRDHRSNPKCSLPYLWLAHIVCIRKAQTHLLGDVSITIGCKSRRGAGRPYTVTNECEDVNIIAAVKNERP